MTPEFNHCALHVRDLDRSIAFYESYCGLRIVKEHGQGRERTPSIREDQDLTLTLLTAGYTVLYDSSAIGWTEVIR
jgi:catechol 2,3-dioxygenase-like lactoylglutathione lyase family enzyme